MGVIVKIEDMIIPSPQWWYGHVICLDINSQIGEVMELEITGKRKKGRPRKSWEECVKKELERYCLRRENAWNGKSKLNCQPRPAGIMALKRT